MWSQTLGGEAETMLWSTTPDRPLPGAMNESAASFLPPPSLKFSSLYLFTLDPCIKACPLRSTREKEVTFWKDLLVEDEKMVGKCRRHQIKEHHGSVGMDNMGGVKLWSGGKESQQFKHREREWSDKQSLQKGGDQVGREEERKRSAVRGGPHCLF